jgi:hypothetical protein
VVGSCNLTRRLALQPAHPRLPCHFAESQVDRWLAGRSLGVVQPSWPSKACRNYELVGLWHLFNFFWNSVWNRPMQRSYTVESGAMFECLSMPQVDAFARLTSKWVWPLCIAMTHGHYALRKGRVLKRSSNFLSLSSERRDKRAFARTSRTYSVTLWKQYRQQTRCTSNAQVK